jgi:hypothetical protein
MTGQRGRDGPRSDIGPNKMAANLLCNLPDRRQRFGGASPTCCSTPIDGHLQIVLGAIAPPGFSSKDYADAPPLSPALVDR